jgi:hypothetical protein
MGKQRRNFEVWLKQSPTEFGERRQMRMQAGTLLMSVLPLARSGFLAHVPIKTCCTAGVHWAKIAQASSHLGSRNGPTSVE